MRNLQCDGNRDCPKAVSHIDNRGFVYCEAHGCQRKASGIPTRKLTDTNIQALKAGLTIRY
jgi:hypothetical protein